MLTFGGRERGRFCDGRSRRDFLKVGGLALGGLALPDLLRAEAASGVKSSHKAVIMVFLPGGPAHQDTVDLKPVVPSGIRGEFQPIPTNVPGLDICELMPNMARIMDKVAVLRAVVGAKDEHAAFQCLTGFTSGESKRQGGRPSLGSVVSKVQGPMVEEVPPFIGLSGKMTYKPWSDNGDPGYLGLAHAPYQPNGAELPDLSRQGLSLGRVGNRRNLLHKLDGLRRAVDRSAITTGLDSFQKTAFDILSSRELARALDVTREDPKIRARYGFGEPANMLDGGPCWNDQFLMARRLVEAGARVVTVGFGRWDNHSQNFPRCRVQLPKLDVALSALIEDLHMRGLDKDVTVIAWGEFGRSPTINANGGREHWPKVSCALLAGGGMKTGQVIGSTDRWAGSPKDRPVSFQNVFATLYHNLGISPTTTLPDRGEADGPAG